MAVSVIDNTSLANGGNWQTFNGTGTVAVGAGEVVKPDTAAPLDGTANFIELTLDAAATFYTAYTPAPNFSMNTTDIFGVWIYVPTWVQMDRAISVGGGVTIGLHQTNLFTDWANINPLSSAEVGLGWNLFVFQEQDLTTAGAWSNTGTVTDISVRVDWSSGTPGTDQVIYVGPILQTLQDQASGAYRVAFRCDDGLRNPWIIGYPMIRSRSFPQAASCIPYNNIGSGATVMSEDDINAAFRDGSPILNHGTLPLNSTNFPVESDMAANIATGYGTLRQWNIGPQVFVYPEGVIGDATYGTTQVLDAARTGGSTAALRTGGYAFYTSRGMPDDGLARFNMPAIFMDVTTSATYIALLDKAKRLNQTVIAGFHSIVPSGASGTEVNLPDFTAILDDIKTDADAGDVQMMDIYTLLSHVGVYPFLVDGNTGGQSGLISEVVTLQEGF